MKTLQAVGWWLARPGCLFWGHDLAPGRWVSERVQRARCTTCNADLAVHLGGIPGIPLGASFPWDTECDEMYPRGAGHPPE